MTLDSPGTSAKTDPKVKNTWPRVNLIVEAFLGKIGGSGVREIGFAEGPRKVSLVSPGEKQK